ncbi:MAG: intradiol ring-cleavage dioxygenase, partial [Bacteroidota bacterium]
SGSALFLGACGIFSTENLAKINDSLTTGCVVRPELTEGPVFVEDDLNRSDIRTDAASGIESVGIPLALKFNVSSLTNNTCIALAGARVDIWQCDVDGIYSDTDELGMDTVGQKFLRGHQITDENGVANFTTIYPGWYIGRAVHIHFKIRTDDGYDFTSQLFFDDEFTDQVYTREPYSSRGEREIRNNEDGIFLENGDRLMLTVNETETGYTTEFNITLDLS